MIGTKILIVEDEFIIQMFITRILTKNGMIVTDEVSTSDKVLLSIENALPDLILMDIGINGMKDGIQTAEMINEKYQIPIIFITGNSDISTFKRAQAANPLGIIYKPIDEVGLISNISDLYLNK